MHDDGVTWVERGTAARKCAGQAAYIAPGGSGDNAGIRVGDTLVAIGDTPIHQAIEVPQALWKISILGQTRYTLRRDGIEFQKGPIYVQAAPRDTLNLLPILGRRLLPFHRAFCLLPADERGEVSSLLPALPGFLRCKLLSLFGKAEHLRRDDLLGQSGGEPPCAGHFSAFLPDVSAIGRAGWKDASSGLLLYAPSILLLVLIVAAAQGVLQFHAPLFEARWLLDRVTVGFSVLLYLLGAIALALDFRRAEDFMTRRQLKYLRNGAFLGRRAVCSPLRLALRARLPPKPPDEPERPVAWD